MPSEFIDMVINIIDFDKLINDFLITECDEELDVLINVYLVSAF